jgi:RNA recognition motif-containing protein
MPYKSLNSYLNESNVESTVKLRGIPFRASADDVVKFFKEEGGSSFEYLNVKDVILDMKEGRSTGFALVFLKDSQSAEAALNLDHKEMGPRWIGVSAAELKS